MFLFQVKTSLSDFGAIIKAYESLFKDYFKNGATPSAADLKTFYENVGKLYEQMGAENKASLQYEKKKHKDLYSVMGFVYKSYEWLDPNWAGNSDIKDSKKAKPEAIQGVLSGIDKEYGGKELEDAKKDYTYFDDKKYSLIAAPVAEKKQTGDLTSLQVQASSLIANVQEMRHRLYTLFQRLNFNLVKEAALTNPEDPAQLRQNLEEFMADLFSFYKKASGSEDMAFCYSTFKWLDSYLPEIGYSNSEIRGCIKEIEASAGYKDSGSAFWKGNPFIKAMGKNYYDAYITALRRSVVSGTDAATGDAIVRFHLSEKGVEQLAYWLSTAQAGVMAGLATTKFDTKEEAETFVKDILSEINGFKLSKSTIEQVGNQWHVRWNGVKDGTHTNVKEYEQDFGNVVVQFGTDSETENLPSTGEKTSGDSHITTLFKGDAPAYDKEDMRKKSLEPEDTKTASGKGTAYIGTYIALTLAVHNVATNPTSKALTRYYDALTFAQLINDSYYPGEGFNNVVDGAKTIDLDNTTQLDIASESLENAIKEFLKAPSGGAFLASLRKAIAEKKFVIFGYASSEYLVSQGGHYDLTVKQIGNAQQRCQMAYEYMNSLITGSGNEALGDVPFVPIVWPLEGVEGTALRTDLIELGLQNVKGTASEEWVRKYLENHYTDANINANFQRVFSQIYGDYKGGNKDAVKAWKLLKAAIKVDESGPEPVFSIKNASELNRLISLKHSPIRKNGTYFDNVLGQATRGSMYELSADMGLAIEIGPGVKDEAKKEMSVPLSVKQVNANGKEVPFYGATPATVWCDGKEVDSWVDKDRNVHFKYEEGKTYQIIAYAANDQRTLGTKLVKRTEKAGENTFEVWKDVVSGQDAQTAHPGEYIDMPFTAARRIEYTKGDVTLETKTEGTESYLAFAVRLGGNDIPSYFVCPGEVQLVEEFTYSVGGKDVVIDRGLQGDGVSFTKGQLISMAKTGVVAIEVKKHKIKNKDQETVYVTLDGRTVLDPSKITGARIDGGKLVLDKPIYGMREVLSTSTDNSPNSVRPGLPPYDARNEDLKIQRSILLPDKSIKIGNVEYSVRQIRKLAKEHVIAIVDDDGTGKPSIYGLDGSKLGYLLELSSSALPKIKGILTYRPKSGQTEFTWKTYVPDMSNAREMKSYIFSPTLMGKVKIKGEADKTDEEVE